MRQIALVMLCALGLPLPAFGQLSFTIGTIRRDTLYSTVDDCMALLNRVEGLRQLDTVFSDTFPEELRHLPLNTLSPVIRHAAQQCSRKFTVAQLLTNDALDVPTMKKAFILLYRAERIPEALAFAKGWLSTVQDDTLRAELRQRLVEQTLRMEVPTRFDVIRELSREFVNTPFWWREVDAHSMLMQRAIDLRDTIEIKRTIAWLLETPARLGDSLLKTPQWTGKNTDIPGASRHVFQAKLYTEQETVIRKLRESTANYTAFLNTLRKELGMVEDITTPEIANPIIVPHWIPEQPSTPRPTRGKVGIVLTQIATDACTQCWMLKRIARKFPDIELTMVHRTHGQYGRFFGTVSTTEELRLLDSIHRKFQEFPGMIAVEETKFWRVDEQYDRRVIEEPGPNQAQYPTLCKGFCNTRLMLIDKNGQVLRLVNITFGPETSLELIIQALLNQKSEP